MKSTYQSVSSFVLFAFAIIWPWGVYQYVPGANCNLTTILALLILTLFICGIRYHGFSIAFEIIWPVILIASLILIAVGGRDYILIKNVFLCLTFFVATRCLAVSKRLIEYLLLSSTLSIGCVAAFALMAKTLRIMPTAYALEARTSLCFPYNMTDGSLALLLCVTAAIFFALSSRLSKMIRVAASISALCAVILLVVTAIPAIRNASIWKPPIYAPRQISSGILLLTLLWLISRIAAKIEVDRQDAQNGIHVVFIAIITVAAIYSLLFQPLPQLEYAFILGLACAYASPRTTKHSDFTIPHTPIIALLCLVPFNVLNVYPENYSDPRNYEIKAQEDYRSGDTDTLERRLSYIEKFSPNERRTHLWRSRIALKYRNPIDAADEFAEAMKSSEDALLPRPTPSEKEDIIVRLRDICSALPDDERGLAYEKALAASGDIEGALAALKLRVKPLTTTYENLEQESLARILATLIGNMDMEEQLEKWPTADLISILDKCDVDAIDKSQ